MSTDSKKSWPLSLYLAVGASGFAALVYQTLWLRQFGLNFGSTSKAIGVVLAVFMAGIALGNRLVRDRQWDQPLKAYAKIEALIAACAAVGYLAFQWLPQFYGAVVRQAWFPSWLTLPFNALTASMVALPVAVFAGMTLPVVIAHATRLGQGGRQAFSALYWTNTLGAMAGTLLTAYVLLPAGGLAGATVFAVLVNVSIAVWAHFQPVPPQGPGPAPAAAPQEAKAPGLRERWMPWIALLSGFSAFVLEVVWTRSLVLVVGASVYAFALMLASILGGIVAGAALYSLWRDRLRDALKPMALLLAALSLLILFNGVLIGKLPEAYFKLMHSFDASFGKFQFAIFAVCFGALLTVALPQGFLFPLLTHLTRIDKENATRLTARLYLWNTVGAVSGSLTAGFILIPWLGLQPLYAVAAAFPALGAVGLMGVSRGWKRGQTIAGMLCAALLFAAISSKYRPWDPLMMSLGVYLSGPRVEYTDRLREQMHAQTKLVSYVEGAEAQVSVRDSSDGRALVINGKVDATDEGDAATQKYLAHLPLTLHPQAKDALIIGWGSGSTAGSAAMHPLESIQVLEIEPEVFATKELFDSVNYRVWEDPRFQIRFNDARRDLLGSARDYDVIISEPSNPWISGVSNLFTSEFYDLAKARMRPGAVFCQWIHYYGMRPQDLRLQLRTFAHAFPHTSVWGIPQASSPIQAIAGDLLLIGTLEPLPLSLAMAEQSLAREGVEQDLRAVGIPGPWGILATHLMDREAMLRFAGDGPLNRDSNPRLEFSAPRSLFRDRATHAKVTREILQLLEQATLGTYPSLADNQSLSPQAPPKEKAASLRRLGSLWAEYFLLQRAKLALEEAKALDPGPHPSDLYLARAYFFSRDFKKAEELLQPQMALQPNERLVYVTLGSLYFNTKEPAKALKVYEAMTRQLPGDAEGWFGKASALARLERLMETREALIRSLELDPNSDKARGFLRQVEQALVQGRTGNSP